MRAKLTSYGNVRLGSLRRANELYYLYLYHRREVTGKVHGLLEETRYFEARIRALLGAPVAGLKMLEIGPGQQRLQLAYFGTKNEVLGIDLDVILQRLTLRGCIRMTRQNGWLRACKTIGRKVLRIDARVQAEMASQLGLQGLPESRVVTMDAARMQFPDNHFDVVFSKDVFEHLSDPDSVISEIRRVLKPGGIMLVRLHLFTSDSGSHDTRILAGRREELPHWAHLRPEYEQQVRSNSYLNRLRLAEWSRIFESRMQGSKVVALCDAQHGERQKLNQLRSQGELMNYSDDELLSVGVEASWRKPLQAAQSE